ncbi:hypothetical protein [Streptomyces sp. NBRC 109706]|uniref:transmembrane-type terpene cyclase n=1 Tax=Streptomyces sp. NBRC 109706 TaxID=1550035 RepID=UPI00078633D8|nr:hypothetical protein [Streptomyces sp. NBRC 109706]
MLITTIDMLSVSFPSPPPVLQDREEVNSFVLQLLVLTGGIPWMLTYFWIIRRGFKDRYLAMPLVPLFFNFGWEFTYSFVYVPPFTGQHYVNIAWFFLDILIIWQGIKFGRKDYPHLTQRQFLWIFAGVLVLAYAIMILMNRDLGDDIGGYTAFTLNAFISYCFILMLTKRKSTVGQTMYIGLGKLFGTLSSSILYILFYPDRWGMMVLYTTILFLDIVYLVMLRRQFIAEGSSPWKKF